MHVHSQSKCCFFAKPESGSLLPPSSLASQQPKHQAGLASQPGASQPYPVGSASVSPKAVRVPVADRVAMSSAAGFATRRKPRHAPTMDEAKVATLPYLEAWEAQLASEEAEAQVSTAAAEVTAKAVIAQGPATALQQERTEEEARSRWAERMQAHLQGVKATEEVRT